jgi:hypothetical protein
MPNKKRPKPGDGQAAELKKLAAKDKKNTQVREDNALTVLLQLVQLPRSVHRRS